MAIQAMRWVLAGSLALLVLPACNTTPVQDGAVVGGALGAATGAIIGHQSGKQGEGALIGAGVGAITGAIVGDQVGENRRQQGPVSTPAQRGRYENRIVTGPNGEQYEERVWVPYR